MRLIDVIVFALFVLAVALIVAAVLVVTGLLQTIALELASVLR